MPITHHTQTVLQQGCAELALNLSARMLEQYLQYLALLEKWNRVYNLTAVRDVDEMATKHILDCLAILPHVQGPRVLDVGTGAGLPGVVIAIAQPAWHYVLLDSNGKKTRFVQQAVAELGLAAVEVVQCRVEAYTTPLTFNSIMSRAYSDLRQFYQHTGHLCATSGVLLAMKGGHPATELAELPSGSTRIETLALTIPQVSAQRHLVKIWLV